MIQVFEGEDGLFEVTLVESTLENPETAEPLEPTPSTPEPESLQKDLKPDSPKIIDEVPLVETPAPAATPQETVQPPPAPRPPDKRRSIVAGVSRPALSQKSGSMPAGVTRSGSNATGKLAAKKIGKPAYIFKPSATYPVESRTSGEEGTVTLRITVDNRGRPTDVAVLISSGFPRLDRSAVEGGWRCRIRNAESGAQFDAPMRFDLRY